MKAGIGSAAIKMPNGLVVAAIVAVNAVGDIIDPATGQVVAGVRGPGRQARRRAQTAPAGRRGARAARRREHHHRRRRHQRAADQGAGAEDGADGARRVRARDLAGPHAGRRRHDLLAGHRHLGRRGQLRQIGALAAEAMADAIVRAATQATSSNGLPAARDLGTVPARFKSR